MRERERVKGGESEGETVGERERGRLTDRDRGNIK